MRGKQKGKGDKQNEKGFYMVVAYFSPYISANMYIYLYMISLCYSHLFLSILRFRKLFFHLVLSTSLRKITTKEC